MLDVADKPVMTVGHSALLGYAMETGRSLPGIHSIGNGPALDALTHESLKDAANRLGALLGGDLERLREADSRGRRSHTPPKTRHRLIELIEFVERAASGLSGLEGTTGVILNGDLLAEAVTVLAMAARWANHPAWPALRATLASDEAPHTVMLLTAASYLVDANNGVGIHVKPVGKTADIWIEPDLSQRVDLEVKTPLALRGPRRTLSERQAIEIVERALNRSSAQRRNTRSSVLAIGGYHMGDSFQMLASTAKAVLALERRRWRGLAGILVMDSTYEATKRGSDGATQFSPVARVEVALHRGYTGDLSISQEAPLRDMPTGRAEGAPLT